MDRSRLERLFEQNPFDAFIALSPVNVFFLSGADIITQRLLPERLAIILWPAKADPSFVICTIEDSLVRSQTWIKDIRGYTEFKDSPIKVLADVIKEKGLETGRLGIEKHYIHAAYFEELLQELPKASFESCDQQLERIRAVKSPEEIERLQKGAIATDKAIAKGYEDAHAGCDELFIAESMRTALYENGADEITFLCLGGGKHSIEAHHHPCRNKPKDGDIVRVDIGGSFSGYYSDLARTAVVGKPTPAQEKVYKNVWEVMEEVIAAIQPGIPARNLYVIYKEHFEKRGLDVRMPHVGHSLGIKLHEQPLLMPYQEEILQPNMVLAIELIDIAEGDLYHNEDLVVVTNTGHEIVSRTRDWSQLFQI